MKPEKQLYQWDVNQYLTELQPTAEFVDYPIGNEVIRLETDGTRCRIPDEVLQTYGGKTCYERYPDGTFRAYSFSVLYAPKPPNYVFTPEERTTFEALTARVDAAIEEIKRRADSGEFTPKKGVDYFTDAEKTELMESVSSGAVGEFRKVVDTATTEYNANAAEKLEAYNQNHTEKVAEYNQNAETKKAEFDSNAAALQTEVDRLRGECDQLAEENRKQENRIDALMKLNKGQTYDVLEQDSEAYSVDVPSGSKYLSVDKVGGKSVVFEQRIKPENIGASKTENGITFTNNGDGTVTVSGTASANVGISIGGNLTTGSLKNKPFILTGCPKGGSSNTYYIGVSDTSDIFKWDKGDGYYKAQGYEYGYNLCIYIMSGAVIDTPIIFKPNLFIINESVFPSLDSFKQMFPNDYYPYCEPTIISSQTDRVDVAMADSTVTQQITTGFPVLNSAGSAYDYIDLNEGKLYTWTYIEGNEVKALTEPVITDITIPAELADWLTVEAGGSVTFHDADESKQLPVPNAVRWVRKLNEVE